MDQLIEKGISSSTRQVRKITRPHLHINQCIVLTNVQSFGLDIDAACGQLYAKYEKKQSTRRASAANSALKI